MCVRHMSTYVCVCVWRGGGSSLGAAADVSVLNDHSACSVWEALALHKGVCVCVCVWRGGEVCTVKQNAALSTTPAQRHPIIPPFFFSFLPPSSPCSEACNNESLNWSRSLRSTLPCRMNTYWLDIMEFVEMTLSFLPGNEKDPRHTMMRLFFPHHFSLVSSRWHFPPYSR